MPANLLKTVKTVQSIERWYRQSLLPHCEVSIIEKAADVMPQA